ncbi:hypothetical protein ACN95_13980 [Gordonia sihwensis]|uniref:hypothetical protein n=1 Tax=Gordonia TaxID=2053 RepID=UPI001C92F96A|nr:hypothetical protein [Gordonia sihwensis]MBY4571126.1 hypothetical protein [Gordonia sihwensis]WFN91664.1 hypothetical protein P5P27_12825 [Gordonia sihwensis]
MSRSLKSTPTIWTAYSKRTSFRPSCCADDFDAYFVERRRRLCAAVEAAMGKSVPRDVGSDDAEDSAQFEITEIGEIPDEAD